MVSVSSCSVRRRDVASWWHCASRWGIVVRSSATPATPRYSPPSKGCTASCSLSTTAWPVDAAVGAGHGLSLQGVEMDLLEFLK